MIKKLIRRIKLGIAVEMFFNLKGYENGRKTMAVEKDGVGNVVAFNTEQLLRWAKQNK